MTGDGYAYGSNNGDGYGGRASASGTETSSGEDGDGFGDSFAGYDGNGDCFGKDLDDLFIVPYVYDLRARVIQTLIKL
jgi:hypothetical protein